MSQSGILSGAQPGTGDLLTLTGDTGGTISPDGAGNINLVGQDGVLTVVGTNGDNTLTVNLTNSTTYEFSTVGAVDETIPIALADFSAHLFKFEVLCAANDYSVLYSNVGSVYAFRNTDVFTFNPFVNVSSNFIAPNLADFFITASTPNLLFNAAGVTGEILNWKVIIQQITL